jgi:hypothetical protein
MNTYASLGPVLGVMLAAIVRNMMAVRRPMLALPAAEPRRPAHDRTLLRPLPLGHAIELMSATVDRAPAGMPSWCWQLRVALDPLPGTSGEPEERTLTIYSDTLGPDSAPAGVPLEALKVTEWGPAEPLR